MSFFQRNAIQSLKITAVKKAEELAQKGGPGSGRYPKGSHISSGKSTFNDPPNDNSTFSREYLAAGGTKAVESGHDWASKHTEHTKSSGKHWDAALALADAGSMEAAALHVAAAEAHDAAAVASRNAIASAKNAVSAVALHIKARAASAMAEASVPKK